MAVGGPGRGIFSSRNSKITPIAIIFLLLLIITIPLAVYVADKHQQSAEAKVGSIPPDLPNLPKRAQIIEHIGNGWYYVDLDGLQYLYIYDYKNSAITIVPWAFVQRPTGDNSK